MSTGTVVDFSSLKPDIQELIRTAVTTRELAYCPYSNFKVGAALACEDKTVYSGCNVENAAYGCSICAERTAIVKAVSSNKREFSCIAVVADLGERFVSPCGTCRQVIAEFGTDIVIYLAKPDFSQVQITSIKELLPLNFKF